MLSYFEEIVTGVVYGGMVVAAILLSAFGIPLVLSGCGTPSHEARMAKYAEMSRERDERHKRRVACIDGPKVVISDRRLHELLDCASENWMLTGFTSGKTRDEQIKYLEREYYLYRSDSYSEWQINKELHDFIVKLLEKESSQP